MATAALKVTVLESLKELLVGAGFKKRGTTFWKAVGDTIHLVALQASQSSTSSTVKLTLNLAVSIPALVERGGPHDVWSAHWRERIASLMPNPGDVWWSISTAEEAANASKEMLEALSKFGLPAQDRIGSSAELLKVLDSGRSPGLTKVQSQTYVRQLRSGAA